MDKQRDVDLTKTYAEQLDKADRERNAALAKISKYINRSNNGFVAQVSNREEDHRKKQEERISEYIFKREKELREKEKAHNERMSKMTGQMLTSLGQQAQEKIEKVKLEKIQDLQQAETWRIKGNEEEAKETSIARDRARAERTNAEFVRHQAANKYFNKRMNRTEYQMNKKLLQQVSNKKKEDGGFKNLYERTAQLKVAIFN